MQLSVSPVPQSSPESSFESSLESSPPNTDGQSGLWSTRHWREAGAADQRERGNAVDTNVVSRTERDLPSATYHERYHSSVWVRGSNCLQKFTSAIARLGWQSSRIGNTINRFLEAQQSHTCTSIQENSHVK